MTGVFLTLIGLLLIWNPVGAAFRLTPQLTVDRLLSKGLRVEEIHLKAGSLDSGLAQARSVFDFNLKTGLSYSISQAENLSGVGNPEDKFLIFESELSKKTRFGTKLALGYGQTYQESRLSASSSAFSSPRQTLNQVSFTLHQELLRNFLGVSDRDQVSIAQGDISISRLKELEDLEDLIMEALRLFWAAFVAKENLKESLAAREKYKELVHTVKRKARVGYSESGELFRVRAEYETQDQNVNLASAEYLKSLDALAEIIGLDTEEEVDFEIGTSVPPLPALKGIKAESLRKVRIEEFSLRNARLKLKTTRSRALAKLDLALKSSYTGLEGSHERSLSEMTGGSHPTYYIGLEFETPLLSHSTKGEIAESIRAIRMAENTLRQVTEHMVKQERNARRFAASRLQVANSAIKNVEFRKKIVQEYEKTYRQGRIDIAELIQIHNELFSSRLAKVKAIGDYHISLDEFASVRDELLKKEGL